MRTDPGKRAILAHATAPYSKGRRLKKTFLSTSRGQSPGEHHQEFIQ
jgi:hypothetical protein